jgi:hypothetical protein
MFCCSSGSAQLGWAAVPIATLLQQFRLERTSGEPSHKVAAAQRRDTAPHDNPDYANSCSFGVVTYIVEPPSIVIAFKKLGSLDSEAPEMTRL